MNAKTFVTVAVAALLVAGTFAIAQSPATKPAPDPRIDTLLEQNKQILQNQQDIMKQLNDIKESITWLRRRSS